METGISKREFARREGCSPPLVRRAIKQGKLAELPDGTMDPALVGTPWRAGNRDGNREKRGSRADPDEGQVSFFDAQRRKEVALARLRELELAQKDGQLLNADDVRAEVGRIARQERDALSNWPARVAPLIAAELGVEQVRLTVILEKHVRDFLAERSEAVLRIP